MEAAEQHRVMEVFGITALKMATLIKDVYYPVLL